MITRRLSKTPILAISVAPPWEGACWLAEKCGMFWSCISSFPDSIDTDLSINNSELAGALNSTEYEQVWILHTLSYHSPILFGQLLEVCYLVRDNGYHGPLNVVLPCLALAKAREIVEKARRSWQIDYKERYAQQLMGKVLDTLEVESLIVLDAPSEALNAMSSTHVLNVSSTDFLKQEIAKLHLNIGCVVPLEPSDKPFAQECARSFSIPICGEAITARESRTQEYSGECCLVVTRHLFAYSQAELVGRELRGVSWILYTPHLDVEAEKAASIGSVGAERVFATNSVLHSRAAERAGVQILRAEQILLPQIKSFLPGTI